jgi:hypothetical protein
MPGSECQGNIGRKSSQNLLDLQDPPSYSSTTIFTDSKGNLRERLFFDGYENAKGNSWAFGPAVITDVEAKYHHMPVYVIKRAELCVTVHRIE